ncbi:MAG TPA: TRAP transporter small permease [Paracoccaceae bacterium]|nr:TRAP transporter small permease [Paracoccaceae bacterium]
MTASATVVRWLDRSLDAVRWIARAAVIIGGAAVLICAFMITADVIMRRVLGLSSWGAGELSYYVLAISSSWAFAHAMLVKAHIRVDMLTMQLSWPLRSASNIIALLGMGFLALMACGAILEEVERAWSRGTTSITRLATPLWIPQGLWLAGFMFFALTIVLLLLRVIAALAIERSHETAELHAGTPTLQDEIADAAEGGTGDKG